MAKHGTRLQLHGSRLLTPAGPGKQTQLENFLRRTFESLLETAHHRAFSESECLATYLYRMEILGDMLKELGFCFDCEADEKMFEDYKASEHCSTHSSPVTQDAL